MFNHLTGRRPRMLDYDQYRKYAVLAPFLPDTQEFLFQIRSPKLHRQPGEICFPGGLIEAGETSLDAAVREAKEELLITNEQISVIAPLDILVSPYNTVIKSYLAELYDFNFTFNPDEVHSLFTVPFRFFLEHEPVIYFNRTTVLPENPDAIYGLLGVETYPWDKGKYPVLFYHFEDKLIWGMTARLVHNIVRLYHTKDVEAGN